MRNSARRSIPLSRPTPGHFYALGPLDSLERAAKRLGVGADALRDHCERLAERAGDVAVAHLHAGAVAFKIGDTWRFRFPIGVGESVRGGQ